MVSKPNTFIYLFIYLFIIITYLSTWWNVGITYTQVTSNIVYIKEGMKNFNLTDILNQSLYGSCIQHKWKTVCNGTCMCNITPLWCDYVAKYSLATA